MKQKKTEKGAIVVEATIGLTSFIFLVYTLLTIINFCLVQAKINIAVNAASKELSQYCYLYSLTGIDKLNDSAHAKGTTADLAVDNVAQGIETLYDEFDSVKSGNSTFDSVKNSGKSAYNSFKSGYNTVKSDPKGFILSAAYATGSDLFDMATSAVGQSLVRGLIDKNLKSSTISDSEQFLRYCRVVPGSDGTCLSGLDLGKTEIFPAGVDEDLIKIVCEYDVSVVKLLNVDYTFHISACGKTIAWAVGDRPAEKLLSSDSGDKNIPENGNNGSDGNNNDLPEEPTEDSTEDTTEDTTKALSAKDYAMQATHNPNGEYAVIGKYYDSLSYQDFAISNNYTYFNLDNYDELAKEKGDSEMWQINKEFLQSQINQRKSFILTSNPDNATGAYAKEVKYLKDHDYEIVQDGPFWKAEKRTSR